MKNGRTRNPQIGQPPAKATFRWSGAAICLPASILIGLATGWIATQVGMRFAPLVIFPLAVGCVLGACLVGMTRLLQTGHRPTIFSVALLSALVAVGSQHYFSYLDANRRIEEDNRRMEKSPSVQRAQAAFAELMLDRLPDGPLDYLHKQATLGRTMPLGYVARGPMAWLSWLVDGLLVIAGTMAVVVIGGRQSFCNCCTSWYRPIRSGHISVEAARSLAALTGFEMPDESNSPANASQSNVPLVVNYRLSACRQGCEPVGLVVEWQSSGRTTNTATVWLDAEKKKQITEIIDGDGNR